MAAGRELPDDLVADVLRRLPPRSLAVSRCVCRAWRDLVDARRLPRADLLPRSVGGIFMNYSVLYSPEFLSRPTTGPSISGDFEFIPGISEVVGHCNGLLLFRETKDDYVVNPATRRWAWLTPRPTTAGEKRRNQIKCLAYDPTVSPHYEVFLITSPFNHQPKSVLASEMLQSEWPPSSCGLQVFSSMTGCWKEMSFVMEGQHCEVRLSVWPGGHLFDMIIYWREVLYVLCRGGSVMRMSMSNAKYRMIPRPSEAECKHHGYFSLGRSEKGLYCACVHDWHGLRIFLLNESSGQMRWELKHVVDFMSFARKLHAHIREEKGPWILQDINYYKYPYELDEHKEIVEDNFEWNSDDDNVLNTDDMVEGHFEGYIGFLGFHPYKEIVFLSASLSRAVAYHWNTSKFQDLGNLFPKDYREVAGH